MMRHPVIAILLALVLAAGTILSGPALAHPQGITVELCVEGSAVTVTLDAQGNPVPAHHPCPHCLAARDLTLPPAPAAWSRAADAARAAPRSPAHPGPVGAFNPTPAARGPPLPA